MPTEPEKIEVGFRVRGPVDRAILHEIWAADAYRIRTLPFIPKTVLDIGAHIGGFALLAATGWRGCRVIACECDADNLHLLKTNIAGHSQIEVVEAAIVGEDISEIEFHAVSDKAGDNSGGGSCFIPEPGSEPVQVPALSILRLWQSKQLETCDLLKLDCEGAELPILTALGQRGLLDRIRHIVGEWHAWEDEADAESNTTAQLATLLKPTHELVLRPRPGVGLGYFTATRKRDCDS